MTVPRTQVLMGLNFSQLTCHFTSTANLTACQLPATRWHAYTRATDASTAAAFDVSAGFLGAGDDLAPPAVHRVDTMDHLLDPSPPAKDGDARPAKRHKAAPVS